jgi:hypothetical protein
MIFFALTRRGYDAVKLLFGSGANVTLWGNKGVLSDDELAHDRAMGLSVTVFTRDIDIAACSAVDEAVDTIKQHHPHECIWVEH